MSLRLFQVPPSFYQKSDQTKSGVVPLVLQFSIVLVSGDPPLHLVLISATSEWNFGGFSLPNEFFK